MSLIVALRSPEGVVVAADSQETVEETGRRRGNIFHYSVQKIAPEQLGNFTVAIAGAGDGELIDAFQERFRTVMSSSSAQSLKEFKAIFESEFRAFYKGEGAMYGRPRIKMIVGACSHSETKFEVWYSAGSQLVRIGNEPRLVGFAEDMYKHAAKELYDAKRPISQNVLIATRLLELARQTSRYIDRPYSVVVFRDADVWTEKAESVNQLIERTEMFGAQVNDLFISMMDLSSRTGEFDIKLREFETTISQLRNDYRIETANLLFPNMEAIKSYDSPYPHLPAGLTFTIAADGSLQFLEETPEQQRRSMREMIKQNEKEAAKVKAALSRRSVLPESKPEKPK